jgi:prepilin-type N-terminal cleavage/methylation domain-containing protein
MYPEYRTQSTEHRAQTSTPSLTLPPRGGGNFKRCPLPLWEGVRGRGDGFTLLELIIVLFLIALILGLSTIFFANILPSSKFNATIRDITATIRHARSLSEIHGERQTITIDLDSKKYGIEGRGAKDIPPDIYIKVIDPLLGEIYNGKYQLVLNPVGGVESGTIVLWNEKRTVSIQMDPVVGSVVIKP